MRANVQTIADLDRIFADWDKPGSPGVAVGIVSDGEPIYAGCFGLANVEHQVPISASTIFDVGSITKQFTAFAVLLLERDGLVCLDDDVRDYVPELPQYDPPVRIGHCLYHTSGISDWVEAVELAGPTSDYIPVKRAHRVICSLQEPMFPAGSAHSYSNTGYVLLARIIERVSGKSLPEFLQERVFAPLGMAHAAFRSNPFEFFSGQAQGYFRDEDGLHRLSGANEVHGDGGLLASIDDMTRWLANFAVERVGDAELMDRFFTPGQLDDGQALRYGAGWMLQRYRGMRSMHHGGLSEGFQSHVFWLPEARFGVAVLGNSRPYLPWRLATEAVDILLTAQNKKLSPLPVKARWNPEPTDICGRYFTSTGLPVSVEWTGNQLRIDIWLWGRPFDARTTDVFVEEHSGDAVTFRRDECGAVTHFTMETDDGACIHMHSPVAKAIKYDFAALTDKKLTEYEGRYVNDEIESTYRIVATDECLLARHLRCDDWRLHPIKPTATVFDDEYAQKRFWPGKVSFERENKGKIIGFWVQGVRVKLFFKKQT